MSSGKPQPADADATAQISGQTLGAHRLAGELVDWFTQNGGHLSTDVRVVYSKSRGYHLQALRPLDSQIVVTCPLRLTLSCVNLDPQQEGVLHIASPLQQCHGKIPDHILTYLLLIEQRSKGKESPWLAYIRCLPGPESMTTPLWFDDEDTAFLVGTSLAPAVKERKMEYHQQWEHALEVMKDAGIALAEEITFESVLWAATIFTSRAFISTHILPDRETVPILFPVVDILNHSVSAKVEWDFQPHTSFSLKLLEGKTFTPNQELFNNYAPKQNDELLLGYGFCLEDNPIEQFPLRLAFPPMLQQYAQETGLLNAENVPYGMNPAFLSKDPNTEQHYLRAKGHQFGRYENCIPFFRGIPPYIVHFFFVQTLLSLELDVQQVNVQRPDARITLQVLNLLYQALSQRSQSLPLSDSQQPQNDKQRYAKIYRDGQAKIIHTVCNELENALARIRVPKGQIPPAHPALITQTEALAALAAELPLGASQRFNQALKRHTLHSPANDRLIWTILLVCLAAYHLTCGDHPENLTHTWLRKFYAKYLLPSVDDGIEDADTYTFIDENLADFLHLPHHENDEDMTETLDNIGARLEFQEKSPRQHIPALARGPTEYLGVRLIMWSMKVAEGELMPLLEEGVTKLGMYVVPWKAEGTEDEAENWTYEE